MIITAKYDDAESSSIEGLAKVASNRKYLSREAIIPLMYDEISPFSKGMTKVEIKE